MMTSEIKAWLDEQFQGDEATIAIVWDEYLRSVKGNVEKAREALKASDYAGLDRLAHTLKGDALLVGDHPMAEAAIALRDASKASDGPAAAQAVERLAAILPVLLG